MKSISKVITLSTLTIALATVSISCASKNKTDSAAAAVATAQTQAKTEATKVVEKAEAKTKKTTSTSEVVCKAAKEERKLAILPKDKGCDLQYTKGGQTSSIASQIIGNTKCEEVLTKVKDKLASAGYNCQ